MAASCDHVVQHADVDERERLAEEPQRDQSPLIKHAVRRY